MQQCQFCDRPATIAVAVLTVDSESPDTGNVARVLLATCQAHSPLGDLVTGAGMQGGREPFSTQREQNAEYLEAALDAAWSAVHDARTLEMHTYFAGKAIDEREDE